MVALSLSSEQQAMIDSVGGALAQRGERPADEVLAELGVEALLAEGGNLLDAALVAEAAGREGANPFPDERILVAAACVGMARRALDDAAAYACERVVFGRPIGEYQGVAHTLADAVTQVDGTRLLIWRALAERAEGHADAALRDAQAFWWAAKACIPAIRAAMRTFGGYGVSEDSPLPALYRTARAALLAAGDPDRVLDDPLPALAPIEPVPVTFTQDSAADEWEARTLRFLEENFTQDHKRAFAAAPDNHIPDLHRKLAAAGLLFPDWPVEWGGSAAPAFATSAVHRTLSRAGWPISVLVVSDSIGKLLMLFGTAEAKAEILPRLARGEALACLGLSEPSGGSDVFGAKTRVRHDGTRWLADGQKVFTTSAHLADYVLLLARAEAGLTLFVAPLGEWGLRPRPGPDLRGRADQHHVLFRLRHCRPLPAGRGRQGHQGAGRDHGAGAQSGRLLPGRAGTGATRIARGSAPAAGPARRAGQGQCRAPFAGPARCPCRPARMPVDPRDLGGRGRCLAALVRADVQAFRHRKLGRLLRRAGRTLRAALA
ncbi:MAG: acyl-CoA dehydrogenase family protein [Novosphingobium sp.]|nr:acyl-CoA dehydrogenase family protein [Novosphingobium sp.]